MPDSSWYFKLWRLLFLAAIGGIVCAPLEPVYGAEYLRNPTIKIARHDRRRTRFVFPKGEKISPRFLSGLLFRKYYWTPLSKEEQLVISYTALPRCSTSAVRRERVYHYTPWTDNFDVLYFDPRDSLQLRRAKQYSARAIPYQPALVRRPPSGEADRWQVFARFIQLQCLPMRFHFRFIGNQRYMEYRSGQEAWKE